MKGFKLDENGDIAILKNKIQMTEENELLKQKVQTVIGTNKGEWVLNRDEGIRFFSILGKGTSKEEIRNEIQKGLEQTDETFMLTSFKTDMGMDRKLKISFTAKNSSGGEISVTNYYK